MLQKEPVIFFRILNNVAVAEHIMYADQLYLPLAYCSYTSKASLS